MHFEFDKDKSKTNKVKHGIDFNEATKIWDDENALVLKAKTVDEPRFLIIGSLNNKLWTSIFTIRHSKYRIISVRRARKNEEEIYYSQRV